MTAAPARPMVFSNRRFSSLHISLMAISRLPWGSWGWDPVNGFFKDSAFPTSQWFGEQQRYFPNWCGAVAENGLDDWDSHLKIGGDGSVNFGGSGQGPRPINDISAQLTDLRGQCFGSNHGGGGANFVFADGAVRFIPQTINLATYNSLCNRNDNKAVTLPD